MYINYWSSKCPYCGKEYEGGLGVPGYVRLGHEFIECPNRKCRQVIRTDKREWVHMSGRQRLGYFLSYSVIGFLSVMAITLTLLWNDEQMRWGMLVVLGGPLGLIWLGKVFRILLSLRRCPAAHDPGPIRRANVPRSRVWATAGATLACGTAAALVNDDDQRWVFIALAMLAVIALVKMYRIGIAREQTLELGVPHDFAEEIKRQQEQMMKK